MVKLVLVRHGQSIANQENRYTGWSDVDLTDLGIQQAHQAGKLLKQTGINFECAHTSLLQRAIKTANIILEDTNQLWIPLKKTWRLNERHYGALRGLNKDDTRKYYGKHQVALWRRSFDAIPPKMDYRISDRRYNNIPQSSIPLAESLKMASERIIPYWVDSVAPELLKGNNQLIVAHGSTIRALIKYLERIADPDIDGVEVYNGKPIIYVLDDKLQIVSKSIYQ